jgi:hypothetical protein
MKRLLIISSIAAALLFMPSCSKDLSVYNGPSDSGENNVEHFVSTEALDVPVKDGYVTIVTLGKDTLAVAVSEMSIIVPKTSTVSKAGEQYGSNVGISYVPVSAYGNNLGVLNNKYDLNQVVCFEDSKNGDYDYNDFVFRVKYERFGNIFGFCIQPIALGSSKSFKLGCIVYSGSNKGEEQIYKGLITENDKNCREQYFDGQQGFINTGINKQINQKVDGVVTGLHGYEASSFHRWKLTGNMVKNYMRVEWYIQLQDGTELYAISSQYVDQSFDKSHLPYGLVITNTGYAYSLLWSSPLFDFDYPVESTHIKNVYPALWDWMNSNNSYSPETIFQRTELSEKNAFPATALGLYVISLFDDVSPTEYGTRMNY